MKCNICTNAHQRGFTLIELMIAVGILAILLAVAAPSMDAFIRNNSVATEANNLLNIIQYTRSEAVRRSESITLCASNAARDNCRANGNPALGYLIFTQNALIKDIPAPAGQVQVNLGAAGITFQRDGASTAATVRLTNGTKQRELTMTAGGLATITTP